VLNPAGEEAGGLAARKFHILEFAASKSAREHTLGVGNDAEGHRTRERKRRTHGHHVVADLQIVGVPKARHRQGLASIGQLGEMKLDDGQIGERILAHEVRGDLLLVGERAAEAFALVRDVLVGEYVPPARR